MTGLSVKNTLDAGNPKGLVRLTLRLITLTVSGSVSFYYTHSLQHGNR
jgi:hypothetical protein